MKLIFKILLSLLVILIVAYFLGPKPSTEDIGVSLRKIEIPDSLMELERSIVESERATHGIKPDNQARIVWADSTKKSKTKIAFLYLHGFTASMGDGFPVHIDLAKKFDANLYLFRNEHHGVDLGDSTMKGASVNDFIYGAERALMIAKKLGDEVIVVGTSLGGGLAIYLASQHPEIKAIVLYAPGVGAVDKTADIVTGHWGYQIGKLALGSEYIFNPDTIKSHLKYWQMRAHLNGVIAGVRVVHAMKKELFEKISCPVFLGYYYKNETEQDKAASVPAMLKMYDELGTPPDLKRKIAFPNSGDHVIASKFASGDWMAVEEETYKWLSEVVLK
ncbi:MAG: alpha/beta hydrolase [Cyclobacteriaceae bacterium]|nr:alpha/beta hydrolase [Cyclobacteriaceae bacterium]